MADIYDRLKEKETESSLVTSSRDDSKKTLHFSQNEIKNQISLCLKLFAENKINDKNAFQLQMIDFLFCALRKHDPTLMNLQMASACLDASSKIYGFRVDKVYSDLMKIVGIRRNENINNKDVDAELNLTKSQLSKRRRKNRYHILSTVQELHGSLNMYNSKSFVNCNRDTQTSNLLIQASLPQHVTHGIALNLFNDILLDRVPLIGYKSSKTLVQVIDDFTSNELCPSNFKFLECFSDITIGNSTKYADVGGCKTFLSSNYSDTNSDITEDNNRISPISDYYENELVSKIINTNQEVVQDFQNTIENHPDQNLTAYEYSYTPANYHINWSKQSHWKVICNNSDVDKDKQMESQKQTVKGKEKNFKIAYTKNKKKQIKAKFILINGNSSSKILQISKKQWIEDKLIESQYFEYDKKRLFNFFNKPDCEKFRADKNFKDVSCIREDNNFDNIFNVSQLNENHFLEEDNFENNCKEERPLSEGRPSIPCNTSVLEKDEAFFNNNLVAAPKLAEKILIPYSKRAKRINMSQFTEALWKNLYLSDEKNNYNIKTKELSSLYLEIPKSLSKDAVKSLSPGLAFISLLHLANEKCLIIENQSDFPDVIVKNYKRDR